MKLSLISITNPVTRHSGREGQGVAEVRSLEVPTCCFLAGASWLSSVTRLAANPWEQSRFARSGHSLNHARPWDLPRAEPFHTQESFCSQELKQMYTHRQEPLWSNAFPRELALCSLHSQAHLMILYICLLCLFHHQVHCTLRDRRYNSFPKLFQAEMLKTFLKISAARFEDLSF